MIRGFWFFSMLDFLAPCLRECVLFSFTALLNSTWGRSFQTVNRLFSISSWQVGWLLAAVMQLVVKLAKACSSCESQLSTELLQDESGRQAVANLKDFLFVLVGQWASPFNCVYEIEDCQHDVVVFPVNRTLLSSLLFWTHLCLKHQPRWVASSGRSSLLRNQIGCLLRVKVK